MQTIPTMREWDQPAVELTNMRSTNATVPRLAGSPRPSRFRAAGPTTGLAPLLRFEQPISKLLTAVGANDPMAIDRE